jgi:hypothetical protein
MVEIFEFIRSVGIGLGVSLFVTIVLVSLYDR